MCIAWIEHALPATFQRVSGFHPPRALPFGPVDIALLYVSIWAELRWQYTSPSSWIHLTVSNSLMYVRYPLLYILFWNTSCEFLETGRSWMQPLRYVTSLGKCNDRWVISSRIAMMQVCSRDWYAPKVTRPPLCQEKMRQKTIPTMPSKRIMAIWVSSGVPIRNVSSFCCQEKVLFASNALSV